MPSLGTLIAMATQRMEGEDQEATFSSYPCPALYYVQSPSTASHANSLHSDRHPSSESALLSPFPNENFDPNRNREASRLTLSRYSSSRGSNNSFLHEKKIAYDLQSRDSILKSGKLRIVKRIGQDVGDHEDETDRNGIWRYFALDPSSSCCCIAVQILWRFLVSIGVALLVFFLVTKPPTPRVSFKVTGLKQFSLGEGLDNTGVITAILSSNCSIDMVIDNDSKVFGLHIHPPTIEMAFGRLKLAQSQGPESFVKSKSSGVLGLHVAVRGMPVYGAGRRMQDMLESGQGLPLVIRIRSRSSYQVVWNVIRLRYLHHGECILVLDGESDQKHLIHYHNSTCTGSTYHR